MSEPPTPAVGVGRTPPPPTREPWARPTRRSAWLITVWLVSCVACGARPATHEAPTTPVASSPLPRGGFRLRSRPGGADGTARYLAEAPPGCSFGIEIGQTAASADPIGFASGALVRRPDSDCTSFLTALAHELGFQGELPSPKPVDRLDCSLAVLGRNLSRSTQQAQFAGGFAAEPAGNWTSTKLFFGDDEGEVFLNLDPVEGVGEFSLKDEDYASVVVTELAKILLPLRRGA
jgi:hypothetical protein